MLLEREERDDVAALVVSFPDSLHRCITLPDIFGPEFDELFKLIVLDLDKANGGAGHGKGPERASESKATAAAVAFGTSFRLGRRSGQGCCLRPYQITRVLEVESIFHRIDEIDHLRGRRPLWC